MTDYSSMLSEHEPRESDSGYQQKATYQPTPEEKAAIKLVETLYREAKADKDKYASDWLKWYKMFRGKQWHTERPSFRHSPVMNFIFSHIQQQAALMTDAKPNFEFIPREPSDREFAQILTECAEADWEGNNWFMDMAEVIYDSHFYGTGVSFTGYDHEANMDRGCVLYESFDPFYFFPDPESRDVRKRCRYIVTAVPTPTAEVKKLCPEDKKDYIKPDLTQFYGYDRQDWKQQTLTNPQDDTLYTQDSAGMAKDRDLTLLFTLYLMDDTMIEEELAEKCADGTEVKKYIQKMQFPRGRKIRMACKCLISDEENPLEDGEFPFERLVNYMDPRKFWGISEIEQIEGPQVTFNKLVGFALDVLTMAGNPVWLVDAESGVEPDQIINRPGAVIPKLRDGDVQRVEGANLQPWVINMIDKFKSWFDELSGSQDVTQGVADRVSAASAIMALQEAAYTRVRLKVKNLDMYLKEVGRHYRNRVMQFYDVPRVFRLTNNQGVQKYFKFHVEKTEDGRTKGIKQDIDVNAEGGPAEGLRQEFILKGELDTKVTTSTSLPLAKAELKQEAIQLFSAGIIDAEEVLNRIDYPNKERVIERMKAAQEQAAMAQQQGG